jgi:hypothetical protein
MVGSDKMPNIEVKYFNKKPIETKFLMNVCLVGVTILGKDMFIHKKIKITKTNKQLLANNICMQVKVVNQPLLKEKHCIFSRKK